MVCRRQRAAARRTQPGIHCKISTPLPAQRTALSSQNLKKLTAKKGCDRTPAVNRLRNRLVIISEQLSKNQSTFHKQRSRKLLAGIQFLFSAAAKLLRACVRL
jgi:hypothetical protein